MTQNVDAYITEKCQLDGKIVVIVCVSDYVVNRELSKTKWTGTRVHKYLYTHLCTVNKVLRFLSNGNTILL